MINISDQALENRYLCDVLGIFCNNMDEEGMKATDMGARYNPEYKIKNFSTTNDCKVIWSYKAIMRALHSQKATRKSSLI